MKAERLIEALQIMQKYGDVQIDTDHDVIYAGPDAPPPMSDEDKKRLDDLGWFISEEYGCWMAFT